MANLFVQDVLDQLGDVDGVHWKEEEVGLAINETYMAWQAMTGAYRVTIPIYISDPNTSPYFTMPSQIVCPLQVSYRTSTASDTALTPISIHELDQLAPGWEGSSSGTPLYWAPIGIRNIAVYPFPSGTSASSFVPHLKVYGVAADAPTSNSEGDSLDTTFIGYAEHILTFKEAGAEFKASQADYQSFLQSASLKNAMLRVMSFYRQAMGLQRDETQNPARNRSGDLGVRSA